MSITHRQSHAREFVGATRRDRTRSRAFGFCFGSRDARVVGTAGDVAGVFDCFLARFVLGVSGGKDAGRRGEENDEISRRVRILKLDFFLILVRNETTNDEGCTR